MALETERCSPNNASSPGPTDNNRRPGLDDCSDQTKEVQSPACSRPNGTCKTPPTPPPTMGDDDDGSRPLPPPPPNPSSTARVQVSAFRSFHDDDAAINSSAAADPQTLACSKPLSICSPLQNKIGTSTADKAQTTAQQQSSLTACRKKPLLQPQIQKPNALAPTVTPSSADAVPPWAHQQQQLQHQHAVSQSNDSSAAAAAAAVEYTMAMAAAAAAAAGHVPHVFPFNSWMYHFNFLPMMPTTAAEYFREIQHHQNGGSPEIDEHLSLAQAAHHLHPALHVQQAEFTCRQRQQLHSAAVAMHASAGGQLLPAACATSHRPTTIAAPPQQTPPLQQQAAPPRPLQSRPQLQQPSRPQPMSLPIPPSSAGYVSRPTSSSGSSDVSSSCGGGGGIGTVANPASGGTMTIKNYNCRSPPSPRSPSPFQLAFSVDNILRPEFGSKLHHHLHQHHLLQQHHHNNNNNVRGRPTSASPPLTSGNKPHLQQSSQQPPLHLRNSPLPQPARASSLLRPAPTGPNAVKVAKRPAPVTAADKAKRKPTPAPNALLPPIAIKQAANDGHPLKPDDPANNNEDDDDEGQQSDATAGNDQQPTSNNDKEMWPAWVYCTRYSDRPSSGKSEICKNFTSHSSLPKNKSYLA